MKFRGYEPTLHLLTVRHYPGHELTRDQWELWWRSMSDEDRQYEYDRLIMLEDTRLEQEVIPVCPICNSGNGHSLSCPTLGVVPVLDLQAARVITAE